MLNVGGGEILTILVVALIFLGPRRLPEVARQIGRAIAEFRRVTSGVQSDLRDALDMDSVRESIDTFREIAEVRKSLVNEFSSAVAHLGSSPPASRGLGVAAPSAPIAPNSTVTPSDAVSPPKRSDHLSDTWVPSPDGPAFRDVLTDDPSSDVSIAAGPR